MNGTFPGQARRGAFQPGWLLGLLLPLGLAAGLILFTFNPAEVSFYPVCTFHQFTGLQCPGCGSLRAMHQLLHGNITSAFGHNPLLVLSLPLGLGLAIAIAASRVSGRPCPGKVPAWLLWSGLAGLILFGILRNL